MVLNHAQSARPVSLAITDKNLRPGLLKSPEVRGPCNVGTPHDRIDKLGLGLALYPLVSMMQTGVDILISGLTAGSIAFGVHLWRKRFA